MHIHWSRSLRTPSSERFLVTKDGRESAAVDLHYLASGHVSGTVTLLEDAGWTDEMVPELLKSLDEQFLPDVEIAAGSLTFTVVIGRVVGNFEGHES
jgi:hypothetical protein